MPFNASGVFQRLYNWVNDRDAAVRIRADRMDQEMDGMAEAINEVVDGTQPLRGNIRTINGTAANPAFSFTADQDTGFYRKAADILALVAGGSNGLELSSSQITALQDFAKGTFKIDGNFLSFENGQHWITYNDGQGNFNIRIGHKVNSSNNAVYTLNNAGAIHLQFSHETPLPSFQVSIAAPGTLDTTITWDHTFTFNLDGTTTIDADKLDGQHGAYYRDATNLNAGTVSTARLPMGAGNNLDADKLDGQHGAYYRDATNLNAGTIPNGRLSGRLQSYALEITDWNDAETNGWYMGYNAQNAPSSGTWYLGEVIAHNGLWTTQTVHAFTGDSENNTTSYCRQQNNGVWGTWYRLCISQSEQEAIYRNASNLNTGTVPLARLPSGSGAGLDADKLDGQHGSFYQNADNLNAGTIPSTRLSGTYNIGITGNAATTTRLTTARNIALTGDVSGSANFDGSGNIAISASVGDNSHTHNWIKKGDPTNGPDSALEFFNRDGDTDTNPTTDWWNTLRMGHGDPNTNYNTTLAVKMTGTGAGDIYTRVKTAGTNGTWRRHWSNANDGANSGLDADLLHGVSGSKFIHIDKAAGSVGQYAFCQNLSGTILAFGATVAGSQIEPEDHDVGGNPANLSGTWRCLGYVGNNDATLFVRIS